MLPFRSSRFPSRRARLSLFLCAALSALTVGGADRIALVPLDSRPATRVLPVRIAQLTGAQVDTPPAELLGTNEHGADLPGLRHWIRTTGQFAPPVPAPPVAATPTTPRAPITLSAPRRAPVARMSAPIRRPHARRGAVRRTPLAARPTPTARPARVSSRLVAWYPTPPAPPPQATREVPSALIVSLDALAYGGLVQSRTSPISVEDAVRNLSIVREWRERTGKPVYASITIPRHKDATRRERNYAVILEMLRWAQDGVFAQLRVTWDDAGADSPAPREGADLRAQAPQNVLVYPGADEVLASLAVTALAPQPRTLRVVYADPSTAHDVIEFDGAPLRESVAWHARANGFTLTDGPADLTLFVYNGGSPHHAAVEIARLASGPLAVADLYHVNAGRPSLWRALRALDVLPRLRSLGAWGTPGNNIGTALSHAKMTLEPNVNAAFARDLLAYEYANDVLFSSKLRRMLEREFDESQLGSREAQRRLYELAREQLELNFPEGRYEVTRSRLPWGRAFEWEAELTFQPQEEASSQEQ